MNSLICLNQMLLPSQSSAVEMRPVPVLSSLKYSKILLLILNVKNDVLPQDAVILVDIFLESPCRLTLPKTLDRYASPSNKFWDIARCTNYAIIKKSSDFSAVSLSIWWFQPSKICSSNWIISPRFGDENKEYLSCHHLVIMVDISFRKTSLDVATIDQTWQWHDMLLSVRCSFLPPHTMEKYKLMMF